VYLKCLKIKLRNHIEKTIHVVSLEFLYKKYKVKRFRILRTNIIYYYNSIRLKLQQYSFILADYTDHITHVKP